MPKFSPIHDPERRRAPRFPWDLEIVLVLGEDHRSCHTANVSLYGAFVITDVPVEPDRVIPVQVPQGADEPIRWVAIVRRIVAPRQATPTEPAGLGLEMFSINDSNWARWCWLIATVADRCEAKHGPEQARISRPHNAVTPRRHVRHRVPVEVRLRSMPELIRFGARDISAGGIFLNPAPPLSVGDEVSLHLHHPLSGDTFELEGRVVRLEAGGAALEFINLDEATRTRLKRFIVTGVRPG